MNDIVIGWASVKKGSFRIEIKTSSVRVTISLPKSAIEKLFRGEIKGVPITR